MNSATGIPLTTRFNSRKLGIAFMAAILAFLAYTSVYAYRKPFTVATYGGLRYWGISYQTLLIISQVMGYMLSKFCGIKFISELKRLGRWKISLLLIGLAWICLLFFAIVPVPYGMFFLFINGFALGFMWGIIFSYVEGRKATDFIGAAMAVSFIFAGGFIRSVAKWLMVEWGVSEQWMPFMTGLVFIVPIVIFILLLERIPRPDQDDIGERMVRVPMTKEDRKRFFRNFGLGIIVVTITYLFLTVMRDIRDNYMANIWTELGYGKNYGVFTRTETNTSLIILLIMAMLTLIRKNMIALRIIHAVIAIGFLIAGAASWLFVRGQIPGALWMQLVGLGLYMGYIPFNCIFFERMIASFRLIGNVGFLIYIADSFGYLGSMSVMLSKELLQLNLNWTEFYSRGVIIGTILGLIGTLASFVYFNKKYKRIKII